MDEMTLSREELLETIRLVMAEDLDKTHIVILFEGDSDRRFVEKYLNIENIYCYESPSGKRDLSGLLTDTGRCPYSERVIALRDRDYADPAAESPRLFMYDDCALELMLLHHPEVRKAAKELYLKEDKDDYPVLPMRQIAPFSVLRRRNEREKLMHDLEAGVLCGSKDPNLPPDMETLFYSLRIAEYLPACIEEAAALDEEELWAITNGHDLCKLLGRSSSLGKGTLGEAGFRQFLFSVYRVSDFCETALYRALLQYGDAHELPIVYREDAS